MRTQKPITVILADDHVIFRNGFKRIMETQSENQIRFIDEAANGVELLEKVNRYHPDIVMTDIKMPEMDGVQACRLIKSKYPSTNVIGFSGFDTEDYIFDMLSAGANGYLVKNTTGAEVVDAIRTVTNGISYYCSISSEKIYASFGSTKAKIKKNIAFSLQEIKVMRLICRQCSTKEIAADLSLSVRMVEDYRHHLLEKTDARNVVGIALYALINGIVKANEL